MSYEMMAYNVIEDWYNTYGTPIIAREVYDTVKAKGYPRKQRTFKEILGSLRRRRMITEKMISDGKYKGKVGYIPAIKEAAQTQDKPKKREVSAWEIELLTKLLKDDDISQEIKKNASYRLRECCGYGVVLEEKETLKKFLTELLDNPRKKDEIYEVQLNALEDCISFHVSEELTWILKDLYPRLNKLFKEDESVELRRRALKCLGKIYFESRDKDLAKAEELGKLFLDTFFNPNEKDRIAEEAYEILVGTDEKLRICFLNKLYEDCKSNDLNLRKRCLKYLKEKVLPGIGPPIHQILA